MSDVTGPTTKAPGRNHRKRQPRQVTRKSCKSVAEKYEYTSEVNSLWFFGISIGREKSSGDCEIENVDVGDWSSSSSSTSPCAKNLLWTLKAVRGWPFKATSSDKTLRHLRWLRAQRDSLGTPIPAVHQQCDLETTLRRFFVQECQHLLDEQEMAVWRPRVRDGFVHTQMIAPYVVHQSDHNQKTNSVCDRCRCFSFFLPWTDWYVALGTQGGKHIDLTVMNLPALEHLGPFINKV